MLPKGSAWCGLQTKAVWPWELQWLMFSSPQPSLSRASKPLRILCQQFGSAQPSLALPPLGSAGAWALDGSAELGSVLPLLSFFLIFPGAVVLVSALLSFSTTSWSHSSGEWERDWWWWGGPGSTCLIPKPSPWREAGKMVHFPSCSLAFPAGTTLITAMM